MFVQKVQTENNELASTVPKQSIELQSLRDQLKAPAVQMNHQSCMNLVLQVVDDGIEAMNSELRDTGSVVENLSGELEVQRLNETECSCDNHWLWWLTDQRKQHHRASIVNANAHGREYRAASGWRVQGCCAATTARQTAGALAV